MTFVAALFRHVQLFFFAFTLAASGMVAVGMASGKLERGETYVSLAETFAGVLSRTFPDMMARFAGVGTSDTAVLDARGGVAYSDAQVVVVPTQPTITAARSNDNSPKRSSADNGHSAYRSRSACVKNQPRRRAASAP